MIFFLIHFLELISQGTTDAISTTHTLPKMDTWGHLLEGQMGNIPREANNYH